MLLEDDDVNFCISKAREVADHYRTYVIGGDGSYKSLDDTKWMCEEYLGKDIEIVEYPVTSARSVEGIFLFNEKEDKYHIIVYVHPELNPDHARFIQFKELFHVLLDEPRFRGMDVDGHIEESQSCFTVHDSEPSPRVVSEALAEIAAMEYVFPYADRLKVKALGDKADFAAIARQARLPQVLIEQYLTDSYMAGLHGETRAVAAA
jgi:hypothetical protein